MRSLKTNDISGVAYDGNPLDKLANIMPTVDPEMVQQSLHGKKKVRLNTTSQTLKPELKETNNRLGTTKLLRVYTNKSNKQAESTARTYGNGDGKDASHTGPNRASQKALRRTTS